MDGKNPLELLQALKYFDIHNPHYYRCAVFRGPVMKIVFRKVVEQKIGAVLRIPFGLREDDPDIDNIADQTFDDVKEHLDAELLGKLTAAQARYATCYAFIMKVATNNAITYQRKHPFLSMHGDFDDDLYGQEAVTQAEYKSSEADSEEQEREERFKERLFQILSSVMSKKDCELIWLRIAKGWDYRDLSAKFKKSMGALRVRFHRMWPKAKEILSDPTVQEYLSGEDNAKHD
jgi:DNA-directed RNA polymerase specialized sigma24 family protein